MASPPSAPNVRSPSRTGTGPRTRPRAPRHRSPSIVSLAQIQPRSQPPHRQIVSEPVQEEDVIERQQQPTRVPARRPATPDWTLNEDMWLTELMKEGRHVQDVAEKLNRTVRDVMLRWAKIKGKNRETEGRDRERQRARGKSHSRHPLAISPLANQASPAAQATRSHETADNVTQRLMDTEVENREAKRRGRERHRAREKSYSRHRQINSPVTNQSPPDADAEPIDNNIKTMTQRIAAMEAEAERRDRKQQRAREESYSRHRPANPLHEAAENVRQRLVDTEAGNTEAERRGRERPGTGEEESHTALLDRTLGNVRQRLAEIEDEELEAERRAHERQRVRGNLWADIEVQNRKDERRRVELQRARENLLAIIEDETREAEWRVRERQIVREELQNRCRPTITNPAGTDQAAPSAPVALQGGVVENLAPQGSAIVEDAAQGVANTENVAQGPAANTEDVVPGSINMEDLAQRLANLEETNRTLRARAANSWFSSVLGQN